MSVLMKALFALLLVYFNFIIFSCLGKDFVVLAEGVKAPVSTAYDHADQPECTVYNGFMVTTCQFEYEAVANPKDRHSMNTMILGRFSAGAVHYVESAKSGIVSTNYQLEHMPGRTISAIIMLFLNAAMILGAFMQGGDGKQAQARSDDDEFVPQSRAAAAPVSVAQARGPVQRAASFGRRGA
jgi:hypothetical protein